MTYKKILPVLGIALTALIILIAVAYGPSFLLKKRVQNETLGYIAEKYGDTEGKLSVTQLITYSRAGVSKTDVFEVRVRPSPPAESYLVIAQITNSGINFYDSKQVPTIEKAVQKRFSELFGVDGTDMSISIYGFRDDYSNGLSHPSGGVEYAPELLTGHFEEGGDVFEFLGGEQAYIWITAQTHWDITSTDIDAMNELAVKLFSSGSWGELDLYRTINLNSNPRVYDGNLIYTDESYAISLSRPYADIKTYYYDRDTMSESEEGKLEP